MINYFITYKADLKTNIKNYGERISKTQEQQNAKTENGATGQQGPLQKGTEKAWDKSHGRAGALRKEAKVSNSVGWCHHAGEGRYGIERDLSLDKKEEWAGEKF